MQVSTRRFVFTKDSALYVKEVRSLITFVRSTSMRYRLFYVFQIRSRVRGLSSPVLTVWLEQGDMFAVGGICFHVKSDTDGNPVLEFTQEN